jgi:queuine tRNA-ribosyltransferase
MIWRVGIDLFDAGWAQRAADVGVALDFQFPVSDRVVPGQNLAVQGAGTNTNGGGKWKRNLGHNLYDSVYAHDFSRLAGCFLDGASAGTGADGVMNGDNPVCPCVACSPLAPTTRISHSEVDEQVVAMKETILPFYTRAYLHHLLHTHEMSSHSFLVMHNLAVLDAFFAGVRSTLRRDAKDSDGEHSNFSKEIERFVEEYDEELAVFDEAKVMWNEVNLARGKGRLAREREKMAELAKNR